MNKQEKKVVIIGAGIAGLSAGSYLARNGFDVEILEMHDIAGGQCTSWKNGKFTFDGCIHWLIGSAYMNHLWNELGALEDIEIINHDRYSTVHFPDGQTLTFYTDPDKLEAELLRFSPGDKNEIRNFIRTIRKMSKLKMIDPDAAIGEKSFKDLFVLIKFISGFIPHLKWFKISAKEYSEKFSKPELKTAIQNLFAPDFAMLFNLFTFVWLSQGNAGYPVGGSLNFSNNIAANCLKHGAKIRYKSSVKKILVEKSKDADKAAGVELENGSIIKADYVISAADGRTTIDQMLDRKYHHPKLQKAWEILPPFDPLFYISLGINGKLDDPPSVSGSAIVFKEAFDTGGKKVNSVLLHSMAFDETLAPEGKSCLEIMCTTDFDFWNNLKNESSEKYKKEKKHIADKLINIIDRDYFPGFKSKIEKIDIATPTTWVRYTGVYRGAFEGLQMTTDTIKVGMSLPKQLQGLNNFYLCGQWVEPGGGLPPAAFSGKNVAAIITKAEGKKFKA
ncbi:MAG: NAD(P)/FAD-dependent oxidoreductase [Spirochaetia bacterium]|nr:NAD(P)/FAD-dependent oxidoreductase [Spirochaetia bacterium]